MQFCDYRIVSIKMRNMNQYSPKIVIFLFPQQYNLKKHNNMSDKMLPKGFTIIGELT